MNKPRFIMALKRWLKSNRKIVVKTAKIAVLMLLLTVVINISSSARESNTTKYQIVSWGKAPCTAYNSEVGQTDSTPWETASGTRCHEGVIASNFLPIGTKVMIAGFGDQIFTVEDRMNKRYYKRLDIWMRHRHDALNFGQRQVTYFVMK